MWSELSKCVLAGKFLENPMPMLFSPGRLLTQNQLFQKKLSVLMVK